MKIGKICTQQKIIWALIGALSVLAIIGIFWLGKQYGTYAVPNTDSDQHTNQNINQNTNKNENWLPIAKPQNQPSPATASGWKVFENKPQGYKFSYPATGAVTQMGVSGHPKDVDPTDGACTAIHFKGGFILILGKVNNPDIATACLRTGVGTEWAKAPDLKVELFGQQLTASGMKTSSASAGYRKEFYHVNLPGGEKVEFSIEVNEKYAPETTYSQAKEEIFKTLKTLEYLK